MANNLSGIKVLYTKLILEVLTELTKSNWWDWRIWGGMYITIKATNQTTGPFRVCV